MFKRGDIVVHKRISNRLFRIAGEPNLNGTIKVKNMNGKPHGYVAIKHLFLATSLVKELF